MGKLDGKVVFVTGAARGIGAGVAAELARRGARVVLTGLEPGQLEQRVAELGDGHAWFEADVTDGDSVRAAVAAAVEQMGGIDVVVANAGIGTYGTVLRGDPDAWLRTVDVNLNGVFRTVHATLPHLAERRGYVCVIASIASYAPLPGMSSYNASKAGVEAFVGALRHEVGFRGIDCGTVHPSWIDTDLVREAREDLATFGQLHSKLPWPVNSTMTLERAAKQIADGIERRKRRVHVPRKVGLLYWLRSLITSPAGERVIARDAAALVPLMEDEIDALGRPSSARTTEINHLDRDREASGV